MRLLLGLCVAGVLLVGAIRFGATTPPRREAMGRPSSAAPAPLPAPATPEPAEAAPEPGAADLVASLRAAADARAWDRVGEVAAGASPRHVPELLRIARNDADERTRAFAAVLLGFLGAPEASARLADLLRQDTSPILRLIAAKSLSQCGGEGAYATLQVAATGDADARVRLVALHGMMRLGADTLEKDLRRAASRETNGPAMRAAVGGLGPTGLELLAADASSALGSRAEALTRLAAARPEACLPIYPGLTDGALKQAAIRALTAAGRVAELRTLYGAESEEAHRAEMMAAVRREAPPGARDWAEWVSRNDPSPLVRREAERALASYP